MTSSSDPKRQYCGSQYFDSRLKYAFSEPLIKFLAFLVQRYAKNIANMSGITKGLQGIPQIFYHFFHNLSTRNAKKSIKPSKTSYYSLECIQISRGFAPLILLDSRTPTAPDVTDCLEKPVKTCQNNLWFCKHSQNGRNRTAKSFFQPKLQVFPHSDRI